MNYRLFPALLALLLLGNILDAATSRSLQTYETISGRSCFRSLDGMMQSMQDLAARYPHLITIEAVGESFIKKHGTSGINLTKLGYDTPPGYDIYAFNITASNSTRQSFDKGKMLITSGIHAREWATPELNARYIEMLVQGYQVNADITWILERNEIHAILYLNPDGRFIAEKYPSSMWRKNLNPVGCGKGVDLNRNFDFMWGDTKGSSANPCLDTYHGPSANSEPETQALVNYAMKLFPKGQRKKNPEKQKDEAFGEDITGFYFDIHAFGSYNYYPWGHIDAKSPDDEAFQALGRKINFFNGYKLWSGGQPNFRYPVTGVTTDYMYATMGVASMLFEIGSRFHQPCAEFEDEILPKNLPSLIYAAKIAQKPFFLVKGPDILELDARHINGQLRVSAKASDGKMVNTIMISQPLNNFSDFPTGSQIIQKVHLYLDIHPDDWQQGDDRWDMEVVDGNLDTSEEVVVLAISTKDLPSGMHTVYVQAIDSLGYRGPVSSVFVNFDQQLSTEVTLFPTAEPTNVPFNNETAGTLSPTFNSIRRRG